MEFLCFPPGVALFHLAYGFTLSLLLTELMFLGFRKIPFTCAHFPGKVNLSFLAVIYVFGFTTYSRTMASFEQWLTGSPLYAGLFFAAAFAALAALAWDRNRRTRPHRRSRLPGRRRSRGPHPRSQPGVIPMLEICHVTKRYRNIPVVNDVSFTVRPGEVTGYLGPNGSGKSTTVKIITTLIEPTNGKVLLDGRDIREDPVAFKRRLGYVPEEAILYSYLTGLEYLQLMGCLRGIQPRVTDRRANDLLELFALHPHRHTPISAYSKGMKQRVLISAALLHDPDLLILDEPLSGIDVTNAQLFRHLLNELARKGKTILYISHVLEVVEKVCARVVIIYKGRIMAADSVEHLRELADKPSLEEIFSQLVEQRDLEAVARESSPRRAANVGRLCRQPGRRHVRARHVLDHLPRPVRLLPVHGHVLALVGHRLLRLPVRARDPCKCRARMPAVRRSRSSPDAIPVSSAGPSTGPGSTRGCCPAPSPAASSAAVSSRPPRSG